MIHFVYSWFQKPTSYLKQKYIPTEVKNNTREPIIFLTINIVLKVPGAEPPIVCLRWQVGWLLLPLPVEFLEGQGNCVWWEQPNQLVLVNHRRNVSSYMWWHVKKVEKQCFWKSLVFVLLELHTRMFIRA